MSLAHLQIQYAAATNANSPNSSILFNSNLSNFHTNSLANHQLIQNSVGSAAAAAAAVAAANIQYHNHQNYLNYQHHYHQSQIHSAHQSNPHHLIQPQQQQQLQNQQHQQRSTFAIQELLGLSNEPTCNQSNFNRSYLLGAAHEHNSKALKISTNFENNHSISSINNSCKDEPLSSFDKKTHDTLYSVSFKLL
jgi:hypothetical protein